MKKMSKYNKNFYKIYLNIIFIYTIIPIIDASIFFSILFIDYGELSLVTNIADLLCNIAIIIFYISSVFILLYILLRNFLLIWLWMLIRKFHPQSSLMCFFRTLQCDSSKQVLILFFSLLLDIFLILLIKIYSELTLSDSILWYLGINSGGLITNFVIFILVLKFDLWKNRQGVKNPKNHIKNKTGDIIKGYVKK